MSRRPLAGGAVARRRAGVRSRRDRHPGAGGGGARGRRRDRHRQRRDQHRRPLRAVQHGRDRGAGLDRGHRPDGLALLCAGNGAAGSIDKTVFVSDDLGAHWTKAGSPARGGDPEEMSAGSASQLVVAAASGASMLYYSADGGAQWSTAYYEGDGGLGFNDLGFTTPADGVVVYGPAGPTTTSRAVPAGCCSPATAVPAGIRFPSSVTAAPTPGLDGSAGRRRATARSVRASSARRPRSACGRRPRAGAAPGCGR